MEEHRDFMWARGRGLRRARPVVSEMRVNRPGQAPTRGSASVVSSPATKKVGKLKVLKKLQIVRLIKQYAKKPSRKVLIIGGSVAAVILLSTGGYLVYRGVFYKSSDDRVYQNVKQIFPYMMPQEKPVVATITDMSKLQNQDFFKNAKNGDRLLVFSAAKIAIIYREKGDAIINMGPLNNPSSDSVTK